MAPGASVLNQPGVPGPHMAYLWTCRASEEKDLTSEAELKRVREIALALPEVNERYSHGAPSFFLRDKKPICYFHGADFASDGRVSIWCRSTPGDQAELIAINPDVFFAPTPSSSGVFKDWIAAFLDNLDDTNVDWDDIAGMIQDAYRQVAPKKLIAQLDAKEAS